MENPTVTMTSRRLIDLCQTLAAVFVVVASQVGCAETSSEPKVPSVAGLGRWEGRARELWDDGIDPAAVGMTMDGPSPRFDRFLRERAQTSALVARLRVQTVTVDSVGDEKTFHLGVQVGYPTLTETKLTDKTFELSIKATGKAFGIARAFDSRMRGRTFIGFIQRFVGDDGEPHIHWHLSPDTAEVAAAVKEAVALRELTGS
jgi:hypothetical protein